MSARLLFCLVAIALGGCQSIAVPPAYTPAPFAEKQQQCATAGSGRETWAAPAPPVRVFGNTYNVGTCGITALLITSPEGHILIDSGVPAAASLIAANIEALGVGLHDVKYLASSHEHYDHVGASAELKRMTGAQAAALVELRDALETGKPRPGDPQAGMVAPFEGFAVERALRDGEVLRLGPLALTAHSTPTHTPGSTSWTWQSCEGETCRAMVYADSLSTPAPADYRFSDHPEYVNNLRKGFAAVTTLPCDILMTPHPDASDMDQRLANGGLVDNRACAEYARKAEAAFDALLAEEAGQ